MGAGKQHKETPVEPVRKHMGAPCPCASSQLEPAADLPIPPGEGSGALMGKNNVAPHFPDHRTGDERPGRASEACPPTRTFLPLAAASRNGSGAESHSALRHLLPAGPYHGEKLPNVLHLFDLGILFLIQKQSPFTNQL